MFLCIGYIIYDYQGGDEVGNAFQFSYHDATTTCGQDFISTYVPIFNHCFPSISVLVLNPSP